MRLPLTFCPTCHQKLDAATEVFGESEQPKAGDVSVCLYCGELLEYDESLRVRKLDLLTVDAGTLRVLLNAQEDVRIFGRTRSRIT